MIVVEPSAIVAILLNEPAASALSARLAADPDRVMSAASYVETGTVLAGRRQGNKLHAIVELDQFLDEAGITVRPIDPVQARSALRARITYGKGMGQGGLLNFGDAFSYVLAQSLGAPLLFIGDDFGTTDVQVAIPRTVFQP